MRDLLEVVVLGRSCRSESGLKVRQPLSRMIVSGATCRRISARWPRTS